ncbi:MAG: DUF692 domain-containing protein [Paludibacterium sp.]|uniref:MNIO family bufferin maturase n=1 Tax=Paludibacterium sp. TaxID=1917523 RepID=UPI0025FFD243|nr:DUF692 domain-containing protein [Paludibacterium sp.]MBV8048932.1 DUF692 domain-containing protein [Paludibacterium sp.]MBV8647794.1 DUF692 domain-containing protein [Paludibacterium sp.]
MVTVRSDVSLPLSAGIGLRAPHEEAVLAGSPRLGWVEVHSENFFQAGGPALSRLEAVRSRYPVSLHGVGMSLGGDALDEGHLRRLAALAARIEPAAISEHLCWSAIGGRWLNDLLPLPYTREALARVCDHVDAVQLALGRRLLVENVSSYLRFLPEDWPEWEFVAEVTRRTGCLLLLDINNVYVSAVNHGYDALDYLAAMPGEAVAEIHLAGYEEVDGFLIDTHSRPVSEPVWRLYREALARFGPQPTLIEWDQDLPPLATLQQEAARADALLRDGKEVRHAFVA